jgi:hypothetical protein
VTISQRRNCNHYRVPASGLTARVWMVRPVAACMIGNTMLPIRQKYGWSDKAFHGGGAGILYQGRFLNTVPLGTPGLALSRLHEHCL